MKKLSMIFGVAAMVLFAACTKEGPANSVRKVVLNASMEENEATKTSLNETTGAVTWNAADQIKVVDEDGHTLILTAVEVNGKSAKFEKELEEGDVFGTIKYAFYPASKFTVSDGNITVTPMGSSPYERLKDQIPSFANVNGGSAVFTNLFGILRMDLEEGDLQGFYTNTNFSVSSSSTEGIFGSYSLDITGDSYALSASACEKVCSWGVTGFRGGTYYFIVPEGAFDDGLTFTVGGLYSYMGTASVTSHNVEIERSKLVKLPILTINGNDYELFWIEK